ncbi:MULTISPECIES: hypothetical protein [unclassified Treponema]|uniref:hypothetical protein n=1 Tax=unclassified Treponema TaxID=2638727 RepID=UPI0020A2D341|nr:MULTISPECIES: hypothetical protein [unclassified Treponema]UTC69058.1 hypothetical protein E4O01_10280 [Treponema sp. OMZ 790]UTC71770.1 hypothetical protein E4O02_10370 [Treponema sp. OMZ 791]
MERKFFYVPIRILLIGYIFFQNIVMLMIFVSVTEGNAVIMLIKELIKPYGFFILSFFTGIIISITIYDNLKILLKDFIALQKILFVIGCIIYIVNVILGLVSVKYYAGIFMIPSVFIFTYGCFMVPFDFGYVLASILIIAFKTIYKNYHR